MTFLSTDNLGFPKAFCCLDGGEVGLGGGVLVDCGQNSVVLGRMGVVFEEMGVVRGQGLGDGWEISLERRESALERSQMSLERPHNRLERGERMQVLDIFRPCSAAAEVRAGRASATPLCRPVARSRRQVVCRAMPLFREPQSASFSSGGLQGGVADAWELPLLASLPPNYMALRAC